MECGVMGTEFVTSATDGDEWSASCTCRSIPDETTLLYIYVGGLVG
jgi:hypothetical protein